MIPFCKRLHHHVSQHNLRLPLFPSCSSLKTFPHPFLAGPPARAFCPQPGQGGLRFVGLLDRLRACLLISSSVSAQCPLKHSFSAPSATMKPMHRNSSVPAGFLKRAFDPLSLRWELLQLLLGVKPPAPLSQQKRTSCLDPLVTVHQSLLPRLPSGIHELCSFFPLLLCCKIGAGH